MPLKAMNRQLSNSSLYKEPLPESRRRLAEAGHFCSQHIFHVKTAGSPRFDRLGQTVDPAKTRQASHAPWTPSCFAEQLPIF